MRRSRVSGRPKGCADALRPYAECHLLNAQLNTTILFRSHRILIISIFSSLFKEKSGKNGENGGFCVTF